MRNEELHSDIPMLRIPAGFVYLSLTGRCASNDSGYRPIFYSIIEKLAYLSFECAQSTYLGMLRLQAHPGSAAPV